MSTDEDLIERLKNCYHDDKAAVPEVSAIRRRASARRRRHALLGSRRRWWWWPWPLLASDCTMRSCRLGLRTIMPLQS